MIVSRDVPQISSSVPHSARMWDYWLGGKDHYEADRKAGEQAREAYPGIVDIARTSRALLSRTVRYLISEAGIRQFLDIGTGLPTADNTHEIAQRIAPESRIVYVDNDPLVLTHARTLLTSSPEGATDYLHADVNDPAPILEGAARTLDLSRPVGLIMFGIVGHVPEHAKALSITRGLLDGLAAGSHLALYTGTDGDPDLVEAERRVGEHGGVPYRLLGEGQVRDFFADLELVEPGVVPGPRWRPEGEVTDSPADIASLCGLGRKG
ncbi:S-adenosyl methyltransferase [Streptomyces abyssalis]|uniref:S-adenosyl methyltransferase n=1 Tax=Streptomyces abyssalis TaxID=933944 RepID=A0A1E7JTM7_9ACTN|nr:S-adenosyl methyltransferase [Streptomyces abyssalis]OEU94299.1 S-adenosyl methyltransferase [Streptomyces abyssalis]OEV30647.1 S-adenosyl methyltransferase [Streptomyces nanshensis]